MADGTVLNSGSGGDTIATDDVTGGVADGQKVQRVKAGYGSDNSYTDVDTSNPLPVDLRTDNLSGNLDVNLAASAATVTIAGAHIAAEGAALGSGVLLQGDDGTDRQNVAVDATTGNLQVDVSSALPAGDNNIGNVDIASSVALDVSAATVTVGNGGTFAVQEDGAALTALQLIDDPVFADDAAFTLTTSKVMVAGAIRDDTLSTLSAVEGDAVPIRVDANGAVHVTGSSGSTQYTEDTAHTTGDTGTMALAVRNDTRAALAGTDGDYTALQTNSSGDLRVEVASIDGSQTDDAAFTPGTDTVSMIGALFDDTGTDTVDEGDGGAVRMTNRRALYTTFETPAGDSPWDDTNDALQVNVVAGSTSGTEYDEDVATPATISGPATMMERDDALSTLTPVEGDWVAMRSTAEGALWVQDFNSDAILADTASMDTNLGTVAGAVSGTEMQVDVVASLPAGTNNIGDVDIASALPAGTNNIGDVDIASALPAGTNVIGDVGISGARTSGGTTIFRSIDLDETEEEVKATAGQIYWIHCMNLANAVRYLKVYNATAANVTVGSTTPVMTFPIATQGDTNGAGFVLSIPNGIALGTAITVAATTGIADNDTGAPGANEVVVNLGYG